MALPDCASVARVRRAHGVRGALSVESLTDEPDAILAAGRRLFQGTVDGALWLDPATRAPRALHVTEARPTKDGWLLTLAELTDRTEAERWHGRHLLVPVEELTPPAEDEVFTHELIGMTMLDDATGASLGEVIEVFDLPQGLLLEFRGAHGVHQLPFIDAFVLEVDREARTLRVRLPDGLLET